MSKIGDEARADGLTYDELAEQEQASADAAYRFESMAKTLKDGAALLLAELGMVGDVSYPATRKTAQDAMRRYNALLAEWDRKNPRGDVDARRRNPA